MMSMIIIHFKNFRSFGDENTDILATEYTVDDMRGSSQKTNEMTFKSLGSVKSRGGDDDEVRLTTGVRDSSVGGMVYDTSVIESSVYQDDDDNEYG